MKNETATLAGISVVIPAAGVGVRMSAGQPKQYVEIAGRTILEHTMLRFLSLNPDSVTLVVSATDNQYSLIPSAQRCKIVTGGVERAESVLNGLENLALNDDQWVMVTDAVRPCVRAEDILRLKQMLTDDPVGGLLAIPVSDTVKRVENSEVVATVDRSALWLAQTPQMFRYGLLKSALLTALDQSERPTDEASAVEQAGYRPRIVEGSADNIKITRPADVALASHYLQVAL